MVNWSDPQVVAKQAQVFAQVLLAMLGLYSWEVLNTMTFDYKLAVNWKEFKWPMAVYVVCRYSMWMGVIMLVVANNLTHELNCQIFYTIIQLFGNVAIGTASALLMLRAIAIWSRKYYILFGLLAVALGHWAILFLGVLSVRAAWNAQVGVCVVTGTSTTLLRLVYGYTMAFDLTVLVVSTFGLLRSGGTQGSGLWKLLFRDGIVYFMVAFVGNAVAAVFTILHLNAAMDIMFTVPAAVFSTIVACRAVRRLSEWAHKDVYVHSHSRTTPAPTGTRNLKEAQRPGIHITMETYTAQREESFYDVERAQVEPTNVDLRQPHGSEEDLSVKNSSARL
ncbi:Transmembrane protein [Ceratobasidium theobromae]|uniref:Transmembrane protein n=1 Tax=Ceratobasidium theobromae TaxID=1582974 RepID=A0A5N5QNQ5_9AGAM|nr:Transmembrane protein [Ceratobasidium theobromae]